MFFVEHMDVSKKIWFFSPQIINFDRVFHEINHPFWGTTIFGNIYTSYWHNILVRHMIYSVCVIDISLG